jgi:hypothetical protein
MAQVGMKGATVARKKHFDNLQYWVRPEDARAWDFGGGGVGGGGAKGAVSDVTAAKLEAIRIAVMIDALPELIFDPDTPELVSQACIECFFAHVRTLIEFLEVKPTRHKNDVKARDTLGESSTWAPLLTDTSKATLYEYWKLASQHLAHFSKARHAQLTFAAHYLEKISSDVLDVWDQYANVSNDPLVPHRSDFAMWRTRCRTSS